MFGVLQRAQNKVFFLWPVKRIGCRSSYYSCLGDCKSSFSFHHLLGGLDLSGRDI